MAGNGGLRSSVVFVPDDFGSSDTKCRGWVWSPTGERAVHFEGRATEVPGDVTAAPYPFWIGSRSVRSGL